MSGRLAASVALLGVLGCSQTQDPVSQDRPLPRATPATSQSPPPAPVQPAPAEPAPVKAAPVGLLDDITSETRLDLETLAARYPRYRVSAEPRNLWLHQGSTLVAGFTLDDEGHPRGYNLYAKGPEIAGTELQIGASFDEVVRAMPPERCYAEYGAEPWVMCERDQMVFTWVVGNDLEDAAHLSVDDARALVGRRGLESVQMFITP